MALPEYPMIDVEDYLILDKNSTNARYEYLEGELRMLAGGSVYHSIIATSISSILYTHLRNKPCNVFNSDIKLQLSQSRYIYPDVTVSCDQQDQEQGNIIYHPCVVVEVLSPGTEIIDRVKKLAYYRECPSIQEYAMIDSQRTLVEIYHRTDKGWILKTLGLEDVLELESLEIHIPVRDIYEKIRFKNK